MIDVREITDVRKKRYFDGFAWAVTAAFMEPLANCLFEKGDTLYSNTIFLETGWGSAIRNYGYSVQVLEPKRGMASNSGSFLSNWDAEVVFTLTQYPELTTKTIHTKQGNLYHLLWHNEQLFDIELPKPQTLAQAKKILTNVLKNLARNTGTTHIFAMAFDYTNQLTKSKLRKVHYHLSNKFKTKLIIERSLLPAQFIPTVSVAIFEIDGDDNDIRNALKKALQTSDKNTEKNTFSLNRHGYYM